MAEHFSLSQSQLLQDLFVLTAIGEKHGGYFVEVGVGSGKEISNSWMLEKHFGWNGILVEPNKSSHESILACRNAHLEKRAAASTTGNILQFEEIVGAGEYSRVADTGGLEIAGAQVRHYDVESVTLNQVLAERQAPLEIDYLSIDTEGNEVDILGAVDFDKYTFKVMTLEHNGNERTLAAFKRMLEPKGYHMIFPHISGFDAWYIHHSIKASAFV